MWYIHNFRMHLNYVDSNRQKLRISEESLFQSRKNSLFFKTFRSAVLERFGKDELEDLFSLSLV